MRSSQHDVSCCKWLAYAACHAYSMYAHITHAVCCPPIHVHSQELDELKALCAKQQTKQAGSKPSRPDGSTNASVVPMNRHLESFLREPDEPEDEEGQLTRGGEKGVRISSHHHLSVHLFSLFRVSHYSTVSCVPAGLCLIHVHMFWLVVYMFWLGYNVCFARRASLFCLLNTHSCDAAPPRERELSGVCLMVGIAAHTHVYHVHRSTCVVRGGEHHIWRRTQ